MLLPFTFINHCLFCAPLCDALRKSLLSLTIWSDARVTRWQRFFKCKKARSMILVGNHCQPHLWIYLINNEFTVHVSHPGLWRPSPYITKVALGIAFLTWWPRTLFLSPVWYRLNCALQSNSKCWGMWKLFLAYCMSGFLAPKWSSGCMVLKLKCSHDTGMTGITMWRFRQLW